MRIKIIKVLPCKYVVVKRKGMLIIKAEKNE